MLGVTGATGELGGRVASRLAARGVAQVLVVRDTSRAPKLEGAEVRQGPSYGDAAGMREAFAGIDDLYLVSAEESVNRLPQHLTAVEAAAAAGVKRVAYTSFVNCSARSSFTLARHHHATEEAIRESGMEFCFLRSDIYADFMPFFASPGGVIKGPAGDGRFAPVSRDDLADCAVAVLTADGAYDGRTFELTGPDLLSMAEVAARLSAHTGRGISYEQQTIEQAWESRRPSGAPDWQLEAWVSTYTAIANGELELLTDAVEELSGHSPQTLEQCLQAHPEVLEPLGD